MPICCQMPSLLPCEAPHTTLCLGKLLAVFSVTEFSVSECMSPFDLMASLET